MWKCLGVQRLPAPTITILLGRLLADARGRGEDKGTRGNLINVKLCKDSSPPFPTPHSLPLVPQFWTLLLEGSSQKRFLCLQRTCQGASGIWGGIPLFSERLGNRKPKRGQVLCALILESIWLLKHYKLSDMEIKSCPCNKIDTWSPIFLQLSAEGYL